MRERGQSLGDRGLDIGERARGDKNDKGSLGHGGDKGFAKW